MHILREDSDLINTPIECFYFDSEKDLFPVKQHWHYYMEIIYMINGTAKVCSGDMEHILHSGELMLFYPKMIHSIFSNDNRPLYFAGFKLDISRMNMTSNYSPKLRSIFRFAEKTKLHTIFNQAQAKKMNADEIFHSCIQEYNMKQYCYDLIIRSQIYQLLIALIRCWQENGFVIGSDIYAEDGKYDIYTITEYIDENMNSDLRVADIATKCGMSYSHFAKNFNLVYHQSCKSYIEEMRIHKAKDFLMFTNFDLSYISQESGFSDSSHMIKSFKLATGLTPGEFRKQNIKGNVGVK